MAAMKAKAAKKPTRARAETNGVPAHAESSEVLTLAEAAAYLRVAEENVINAVASDGLPGRRIGSEWRFSKASLTSWLGSAPRMTGQQGLLAMAGKFKDDPYLDEICKEAYRQRGRPITEDPE